MTRTDAVGSPELGDQPPEDFRRLAREMADWMADYLSGVGALRVFPKVEPGEVRAALSGILPVEGEALDHAFRDFREVIVPGTTHWNHPGFFGYFSITGSGPGVLGEMLAAALSVNAMVWRSAPAATELEELATDWLRQLVGLPRDFDGVINDTASSSSFYALATARDLTYPSARDSGLFGEKPGRVYASQEAHSSIEKGVLALGLGKAGTVRVPTDAQFRMDVARLRDAIRRDRSSGYEPVAIVATLGTTSTASVDPVKEIAEVAREEGIWLHVDAAYGGVAGALSECAHLFEGWESADSIVVNPHKWLFTPVDCSVLFCRRPEDLVRAFSVVPEYLRSAEQGTARSLMDYGLPLGRRFRALKLWFVLRYFGRSGIERRLRAHIRLAEDFATRVRTADAWELAAPVSLSTVAFRHAPPDVSDERSDQLNLEILERVNASGEVFLTHTALEGRVALRISVGNIRTESTHVARAWELLEAAATAIAGESGR